MIENKKMKWIIILLLLGVVGFAYYLYVADWKKPMATFVEEAPQPYITAEVDSTIARRKLFERPAPDSAKAPSRRLMVMAVDSDSMRVNLDRPLQEVVTIDMEEHKEHVFFTWDDIKAYFDVVMEYVDNYRKK